MGEAEEEPYLKIYIPLFGEVLCCWDNAKLEMKKVLFCDGHKIILSLNPKTRRSVMTQKSSKNNGGGMKQNVGNTQRANQMNPNNSAFSAAQNNRANQLNPNNSAYQKSRGK